MESSDTPVTRDLVLVGGGHSHLAVLKMFGMEPISGVRLTLITRDLDMAYSGMLPGMIAGHYDYDEAHVDLRPLARFADARVYHTSAVGLDLEEQKVFCEDRPPVAYDRLSINIGSTPRTKPFDGADEHAIPVKPIDEFLEEWESVRAGAIEADGSVDIAVVGAGAGGTELTLATQYRLQQDLASVGGVAEDPTFHLFSATDQILPNQPRSVRRKFERVLGERDVEVHEGTPVTEVGESTLRTEGGDEFPHDAVFWVTDASPADWIEESGLATDDGFVEVNDYLQSTSHRNVFAAGDIASMTNYDRPKSGVFAVRHGKPLEKNLRRSFSGWDLKAHSPQKRFLQIISTGDQYAVATRRFWAVEGEWVWNMKDWIDRRWMEKWRDLPEMGEEELDEEPTGRETGEALEEISAVAMRCGGCGAKIGSSVLDQVLERLDPIARDDVLTGLDSPDDAAVVEVPDDHVMVHTVDFFRSFIEDPYLFGRIASNHALGDVFAMNAEPQSALALCTVPFGPEAKVAEQLYQLMAGAVDVLNETGTALVGGHSAEGEELAFGLEVNATAHPDDLLHKEGLRPGDKLVLTKPVGTGTLFAADMRHRARGRWVHGALEFMGQSNARAATCLAEHGAEACTDVTGFGLLGHLVEMTRPSEVDAVVDLSAIPVLDGAMETIRAGVFSSLQPENVRLRRAIRNQADVVDDPLYPLLFDPQTAGGLLAGVPGEHAEACVEELREMGYAEATIVGRVEELSDELEPILVEPSEATEEVPDEQELPKIVRETEEGVFA